MESNVCVYNIYIYIQYLESLNDPCLVWIWDLYSEGFKLLPIE